MTHKLYDLAVKTGTYQKNGEEKGRYENIGSVMQGDKGQFLILKRTFNPAGVPNPDCKDSVLVSCFEPKDSQNNQQQPQQQYGQRPPQNQHGSQPQQTPQAQYSQQQNPPMYDNVPPFGN